MSATFELTMYEDKTLPVGKQLFDLSDLAGHTIKAVFETTHQGRLADLVLVTETDCFIGINAEMASCCSEDEVDIVVHRGPYYGRNEYTLMSYVPAQDLLHAGMISKPVFDELDRADKAKEAAAREEKARGLRAELAKLEGGAA